MSEEDVEIVRELFKRRERGDFGAIAEFLGAEIEFAQIGSQIPDFAGEWHGLEAMRRATIDYLEAWENLQYETRRIIDGVSLVFVLEEQRGRGKHSGVEAAHEIGHLLTVRAGRVARWESYWDPTEALKAAGLSE
jgi:ketosteroid isomerase-like protein